MEKKENKKIMEDTRNNMYNADQDQIASIVNGGGIHNRYSKLSGAAGEGRLNSYALRDRATPSGRLGAAMIKPWLSLKESGN